jgi:hypothetical protein
MIRHIPTPKPTNADEADTPVIDTIGLNDRTPIDDFRTPLVRQATVTNHWKLAEGGQYWK